MEGVFFGHFAWILWIYSARYEGEGGLDGVRGFNAFLGWERGLSLVSGDVDFVGRRGG